LFDEVAIFVNKSYAELKKFFDDLFAKIKDWLLKKVISSRKAYEEILSKLEKKTASDELFRKIMEKLAVGQTLSPSIIKAFRLELQRLGVGLEIVSSKNPETKLLWKKMALGQTKEGGNSSRLLQI